MNSWMLVAALASPVITLLAIVYWTGQNSQVIKQHADQLVSHGLRLDGHDDTLSIHAEQLAEAKGFRQGFSAARGEK